MADTLSDRLRTFVSIDTVAQKLLREAAASLDRTEALEQALRDYGEHFERCNSLQGQACDCGLDAAIGEA